MIMVADSVPSLKRWVGALGLKDSTKALLIRVVVAFLLHAGRMSCLRAAGSCTVCETRHRAQISRFLWMMMAEAQYQHNVAVSAAGVRGSRGPFRVDRRCDVGQPGRQENQKHLQHGTVAAGARGKDVATAKPSTPARTATASRWHF